MKLIFSNKLKLYHYQIRTSSLFHGINKSLLSSKNVVFIDGARTPFCKSGTSLSKFKPHQLGGYAIKGLLERIPIKKNSIDYICMGTVIQEISTSNVARESMLVAELPIHIPAHTVTMACISSDQAIVSGINMIQLEQADVVIAGGVDTLSDPPIKISKALRNLIFQLKKAKTLYNKVKAFKGFKLKDIGIEIPYINEFISNESMGHSADRLCSSFGVTRQQQDEYAYQSFKKAEKAKQENHLNDIVSIMTEHGIISCDNTIRSTSLEKLNSLNPIFIKEYGSITAGNSAPLTDGSSVSLLMSEDKAKELNLQPKAYIRDFLWTAHDPINQLLIGPAYSIPKLMVKNGLSWDDIAVIELHEAFAGQVLSVVAALNSNYFCKQHIGLKTAFGAIPIEKLNTWGGSISLGHPFGATGSRLLTMAANRLIYEHSINPNAPRFAIISACASGGFSHAMVIERYP